MANKWNRSDNPPPPLFFNDKEKDFVKQVNDELLEGVVGQQILYYPISLEHSNFHSLYGECIKKTFLNPIRVYVLVEWHGNETTTENGYIDNVTTLTVFFHKKRLTDDQDIEVKEGDFIEYGQFYYEIVELNEPRTMFGQVESKVEIEAKCIRSRENYFNSK